MTAALRPHHALGVLVAGERAAARRTFINAETPVVERNAAPRDRVILLDLLFERRVAVAASADRAINPAADDPGPEMTSSEHQQRDRFTRRQ